MLELIKNKKVNIYTNLNGNNPLIPIATDELFLRQVLTNNECILHIHSLENPAILGTPDTRVPFFKEALDSFYNNNLIPAVRNIGGLGIIADTGVVSFSIIMNINPSTFSLNAGYNLMTEFIKAIFPEASSKIQAVEISNSYCPGDFDLSIDGKKFAGIAQRKVKENVVVSIYLSLFGNQQNRTRIMKEYYETGLKDQEIKYKYPKIDINCMDTLENLLNKSLTTKELLERMLRVLHSLNCEIEKGNYSNKMIEDYEEIFKQTKQRNNKLLHGE